MSIVPSTKGVTQDLSSISGVLGTILQQVKDIEASSAGATAGISGIASGAGKGGATFATTKTGSGANSVGLGSFSPPAQGMSGAEGMSEAKFATSTTKTGMDALLPGSSSKSGGSSGLSETEIGMMSGSKLLKGASLGAGAVGLVGNALSGALGAMPNVGTVIDRATQYYNAGVANGNQFSHQALQSMAANTGLTYTGQDGQVMNYMQQMGVSASNAPDSAFQLQAKEISSASRNLNMDPMAAAQAVTGLNSGATSAGLMRNFGIATSDPRTGKMLNMDQIFSQLDSRIFANGQLKHATADQVQDSFYRGFLGADLQGSGLSAAQQQIYVQQHLMAKVNGQNSDTSSAGAQAAWEKATSAAGNANPQASAQQIDASNAKLFDSYQQPYLDGIKTATGYIKDMNQFLESVPPGMKAFKAQLDTLAGNNGTGAVLNAFNGLSSVIGGLIGMLGGTAVKAVLTKIKKPPTGAPEKAATSAAKDGEAVLSKDAQMGKAMAAAADASKLSKTMRALSPAMSALGDAALPVDIAATGVQVYAGGQEGAALPKAEQKKWAANGPGQGAYEQWTADLKSGGLGKALGDYFGSMFTGGGNEAVGKYLGATNPNANWNPTRKLMPAHGGSSYTVGTGASTGGAQARVTFIMPVNGKIYDGFGPRVAPTAGASTFHKGLDIGGPEGSPIVASGDGTVTFVGSNGSMGWSIFINHGSGYVTKYGHQPNGTNIVRVGQVVKQGQRIGTIGMTGITTGPHVHFQMEINGTPVDPKPHLGGSGIVVPLGSPTSQSQGATAGTTASTTTNAPSTSSLISVDSFMSSLSDSGATSAGVAGVSSYSGASSGNASSAAPAAGNSLAGPGMNSGQPGGMSSMSVPGAKSYKSGDPYVAQDQHVNVHTGEAILNEDQANEWRAQQRDGHNRKSGSGNSVTINLQIADASDEQARAFAKKVKGFLNEDTLYSNMQGR